TFPIDRFDVASQLNFADVYANSMDAVSDRDYVLEFLSFASILMMHLSRLSEEVCLWSSTEFAFIELDDAFATGSSMMPQKKNPDAAELIRGKTGRVYGDLVTLLTVMKGLPLAYNKDMQEDKPAVFDAYDTANSSLKVFTGMLDTLTFNKEAMLNGAKKGFTDATDAADYLVKKGMPFRSAHECIGKLVLMAIEKNKSLDQLTLEEYREVSPVFDEDIYEAISLNTCVNKRSIPGGPAPEAVRDAIQKAKMWLKDKQ
ncbi:MAG TPA: argininosuccinate lyase, partial [Clostridia bacterium]|nr:argininosuccinate lyase [Clostridia bacterium]